MTAISQLTIKAEVINLKQALENNRPTTPRCIFVSSDEELDDAKLKYGEDLDGITVLKWNLGSNMQPVI